MMSVYLKPTFSSMVKSIGLNI